MESNRLVLHALANHRAFQEAKRLVDQIVVEIQELNVDPKLQEAKHVQLDLFRM
jgi:hypothetical protein